MPSKEDLQIFAYCLSELYANGDITRDRAEDILAKVEDAIADQDRELFADAIDDLDIAQRLAEVTFH